MQPQDTEDAFLPSGAPVNTRVKIVAYKLVNCCATINQFISNNSLVLAQQFSVY